MDDLESKPTKELSDVETQKLEKEITDMQIKVLSADNDEYWKIYGELIANPQARKLMQLFARKEMILNDAVKIMDGDYSNLKRHVTKIACRGPFTNYKKTFT